MECYSATKRSKVLPHLTTWMGLESIAIREGSHSGPGSCESVSTERPGQAKPQRQKVDEWWPAGERAARRTPDGAPRPARPPADSPAQRTLGGGGRPAVNLDPRPTGGAGPRAGPSVLSLPISPRALHAKRPAAGGPQLVAAACFLTSVPLPCRTSSNTPASPGLHQTRFTWGSRATVKSPPVGRAASKATG